MRLNKKLWILPVLLIAVLLAACAPGEPGEEPAFPEVGTPLPGETEVLPPTGPLDGTPADPLEATPADPLDTTPVVTSEAPADTPAATGEVEGTSMVPVTPETTGTPQSGRPPSSSGAIIQPENGRADLTRLSTLLGYQVIDQDGQILGAANDFILNLCEAHLLYIVLDGDLALALQGGERVLIPYEIVSLHGGVLNSEERTIQVNAALSEVQTAPVMNPESFDVTSDEWEAEVQGFWTNVGNLSLTTECRVPGAAQGEGQTGSTPAAPGSEGDRVALHKNAFASDVLEADVVDGNGQELGAVEEVLLEPESGRLTFAAVRLNADLQSDQNLVLVPFGAINLQEDGAADGVTLVLLVETTVLTGAPQEASLPDPSDTGWESQSLDYWGEFVPLTRDQLP